METSFERGLIVDSSFRSRSELAAEIRGAGLIRELIEARSVSDGLASLAELNHSACFVGPTLSEKIAVDFLKTAATVSLNRSCAFVAIVNESASSAEVLRQAGATATLSKPFHVGTFATVVKQAVIEARVRSRFSPLDMTRGTKRKAAVDDLANLGLSQLIQQLSDGLTEVAEKIAKGALTIKKDGTASMATRDAIRLAIEQALLSSATAELPCSPEEIGTFDHYFVASTVQWFTDRVHLDQSKSTEALRQRLLSFSTPSIS